MQQRVASVGAESLSLAVAGAEGELLVARIRLAVVGVLFATQLAPPGVGPVERQVGLVASLVGVAFAAAVHLVVSRHYQPWMSYFTSALDVSLVSAALAVHLLLDRPHTAVNSKIIFDVYYLAMACSALRNEWRICVMAGALAVGQYAAIVVWADSHWDLNHVRYAPYVQGVFLWGQQISRLLLLVCAALASTAIVVRARNLVWLSSTDRLTGLANRRAFDQRLALEAARARRYERSLAVALLDIDHFKPFNDKHGHPAGDAALQRVAEALRVSVRETDAVCRYGGEEFALILPETGAEEAMRRLETLRRAVASATVAVASGTAALTISGGLACWPADGERIEGVLAVADARLYQAKRAGRDRVVGPPSGLGGP